MATPPTAEALNKVRDEFGPNFVASRRRAEDEARRLINMGEVTVEQFAQLCEALRRHEVAGEEKHDRFGPTFQDKRVVASSERLGEIAPLLGHEDEALSHLDGLLHRHERLPDAVPRLPTAIMYMRDPERFGYHTMSTMNGLALALGRKRPYPEKSLADYMSFCYDLRLWRQEWGIAPQEHDAVLSRIFNEWKERTGKGWLGR